MRIRTIETRDERAARVLYEAASRVFLLPRETALGSMTALTDWVTANPWRGHELGGPSVGVTVHPWPITDDDGIVVDTEWAPVSVSFRTPTSRRDIYVDVRGSCAGAVLLDAGEYGSERAFGAVLAHALDLWHEIYEGRLGPLPVEIQYLNGPAEQEEEEPNDVRN